MKKTNKLFKILVILVLITVSTINLNKSKAWWVEPNSLETISAYWDGNPYVSSYTDDAGVYHPGNCTWYVWGRANHRLGIKLPGWTAPANWCNDARNSGYSVGTEPRTNSIIVWSKHVAYVENWDGTNLQISECNWWIDVNQNNRDYYERTCNDYYNGPGGVGAFIGFIYLQENSTRIALDTVSEGNTYVVGINDDNRMHIDGWATTDVDGAFIQIYVDDNLAVAAHNVTRYDRPDVSSKPNVGYSAYYNYSGLSEGSHTLKIVCHEPSNGNALFSKIVTFNIIHADIAIDSVTEGKIYYKKSEESENQMTISGWAVARYKKSFVQIYIDNKLAVSTHLIEREQRPDIVGYDKAGYTTTFNYNGLTEGEHLLEVIEFEEGTNQILTSEKVKFKIEKQDSNLGDINGDGDINARDAKLAIQHFTGKIELTAEQIARADVYADGQINARDAKLIIQFFTGKISSF